MASKGRPAAFPLPREILCKIEQRQIDHKARSKPLALPYDDLHQRASGAPSNQRMRRSHGVEPQRVRTRPAPALPVTNSGGITRGPLWFAKHQSAAAAASRHSGVARAAAPANARQNPHPARPSCMCAETSSPCVRVEKTRARAHAESPLAHFENKGCFFIHTPKNCAADPTAAA